MTTAGERWAVERSARVAEDAELLAGLVAEIPNSPHGPKQDEVALWRRVVAGQRPRHAGVELGMHPKRVDALCEKWTRRGIYEYGSVCDLGWPVPGAVRLPRRRHPRRRAGG